MLGWLSANRVSPIAVDFGTCSLRAVQLVRRSDGWQVYHWINVEVDPASADPPPLDYAGHLAMAMGPGAFRGRRAAIAMTPPEVEYRLLDVPTALLDKKQTELRAALTFELDRQLPWPAAEAEIAAWPVLAAAGACTSTMVAAARTSSVQKYLNLLAGQEIACVLADVVPNGIIRLHSQRTDEIVDKEVWGVLDAGFRACRLYLMHGRRPVYARVLRGGGREMTETLAQKLHVEFRLAEQYKRLYGIQPSDRGVRAAGGGIGRVSEGALPGLLYAILSRTIDTLVSEIERSYRFVLDRNSSATTGPLYLAGGGARLKGLAEALELMLGVEVHRIDPVQSLRGLSAADAETQQDMSAVLGGGQPARFRGQGGQDAHTPGTGGQDARPPSAGSTGRTVLNDPAMAICMGLAAEEGRAR